MLGEGGEARFGQSSPSLRRGGIRRVVLLYALLYLSAYFLLHCHSFLCHARSNSILGPPTRGGAGRSGSGSSALACGRGKIPELSSGRESVLWELNA